MPDPTDAATDPAAGARMDDGIDHPRRRILRGAVGAGALLLGTGTASASGRGGQAVVCREDFEPDRPFVVTEVSDCPEGARNPDGSCWEPPLLFQCNGKGGRVPPGKGGRMPFPYWHFQYVNENGTLEERKRKLYTRDNEVRTGVTYRWPGRAKKCGNPDHWPEAGQECSGLIQTGFVAGEGSADR